MKSMADGIKEIIAENKVPVAVGLFCLSIWWLGNNTHNIFSGLFSFVLGASIAYVICYAIKHAD